ncbi:MAG: hypothetical protein GX633_06425 [Clostridiales bacterium]|nr:hypothetical protein [Clostridiales bacterium]
MKFGFTQEIITPIPSEVYLDGYGFRLTHAKGVHDDIYCKVCVMSDGEHMNAIVVFDICGFGDRVYNTVISHIHSVTGIPEENISLCATHTHASMAAGILAGVPVNDILWNFVGEKAAYTVKRAMDSMEECKILVSQGKKLESMYNRRSLDDSCDRRVFVLSFINIEGSLKGAIVSASCHAVVRTDMQISADFPGMLTREAEKKYPGVPFIYLQSRGGDANPKFMGELDIDTLCEKLGGELAESALEAVCGGAEVKAETLKSACSRIEIPVEDYPDEETLKAKLKASCDICHSTDNKVQKRVAGAEILWYNEVIGHVRQGNINRPVEIKLQVIRLGDDIVFAFLPFEVLYCTANDLEKEFVKRGYKNENIFIIGYSNSVKGYLAPKAYLPKYMPDTRWSYEVIDAPIWYNIPLYCEDTEKTVTDEIINLYDIN